MIHDLLNASYILLSGGKYEGMRLPQYATFIILCSDTSTNGEYL
jgi:hypothetical protein